MEDFRRELGASVSIGAEELKAGWFPGKAESGKLLAKLLDHSFRMLETTSKEEKIVCPDKNWKEKSLANSDSHAASLP